MSFCDEFGQNVIQSVDDEFAYLTCDITEPAKDEIHNTSTQRKDEEHQGVKVALLREL